MPPIDRACRIVIVVGGLLLSGTVPGLAAEPKAAMPGDYEAGSMRVTFQGVRGGARTLPLSWGTYSDTGIALSFSSRPDFGAGGIVDIGLPPRPGSYPLLTGDAAADDRFATGNVSWGNLPVDDEKPRPSCVATWVDNDGSASGEVVCTGRMSGAKQKRYEVRMTFTGIAVPARRDCLSGFTLVAPGGPFTWGPALPGEAPGSPPPSTEPGGGARVDSPWAVIDEPPTCLALDTSASPPPSPAVVPCAPLTVDEIAAEIGLEASDLEVTEWPNGRCAYIGPDGSGVVTTHTVGVNLKPPASLAPDIECAHTDVDWLSETAWSSSCLREDDLAAGPLIEVVGAIVGDEGVTIARISSAVPNPAVYVELTDLLELAAGRMG